MAKYRIVVACGTNVTSTVVAVKLKDMLEKRGIKPSDVEFKCIRVAEIVHQIEQLKPDCVVFSGNVPYKLPCPAFRGTMFITGVGMDPVVDQIVKALEAPHWAGLRRM